MNDPKYQFSIFDKNGGYDGQYVVRTDDKEEFEMLVDYVKGKVTRQTITSPVVSQPIAPQVDLSANATCPVHGTPLVWKTGVSKTTNKPYAFWSCPTKNADGSYCKAGTQK